MRRQFVVLNYLTVLLCAIILNARCSQAQPESNLVWSSGFENGFPGEFHSYNNGTFTLSNSPNPGLNEAWTIQDEMVYSGSFVYKGWITDSNDLTKKHRAYPVLYSKFSTPLVNSFMVYLDVDYNRLGHDWIHLATWGNNTDWKVHTLSVRDRKLEMAHLDWKYIGPKPQPDFPLRKWVRITAYIHYPPEGDGMVIIWQDGTPVLSGKFRSVTGQFLMRSHWGMYAPATTDHGVQYNDDIQIWILSEPLTDFFTEPRFTVKQSGDFYFPPEGETLETQSLRSPDEVGLKKEVISTLQEKVKNGRWALWRNGHLVHVEGDFNQETEVKSLRKNVARLDRGSRDSSKQNTESRSKTERLES